MWGELVMCMRGMGDGEDDVYVHGHQSFTPITHTNHTPDVRIWVHWQWCMLKMGMLLQWGNSRSMMLVYMGLRDTHCHDLLY